MEAVLVTRNPGNGNSEPSTADYRLEVNLGKLHSIDRCGNRKS